jgi:hypothetical protein
MTQHQENPVPDPVTQASRDAEIAREKNRHRVRVEQQRAEYEADPDQFTDEVLLEIAVGGEVVERDAAKGSVSGACRR